MGDGFYCLRYASNFWATGLAFSIGHERQKMDYVSHKILHGLTGALANIHKGSDAMASGAAGGALGEVFAECLMDSKAIYQDVMKENPTALREQWDEIAKDKLDFRAKLSKISTAFTVGLFGGDANLGHAAAERAIDNNCLQVAIAGLIAYASYVTIKDYKNSFDENGWDGVINHLHKDAKEIAELELLCAQIGAGCGLVGAVPGAATGAVAGASVGVAAGLGKQIGVRIGKYIVTDAKILWAALGKMKGGLNKVASQSSFMKWFDGKAGQASVPIRSAENASNRVQFEELKREYRRNMEKPNVTDPTLKKNIDDLFRDNAIIGNGSTAAALREEVKTGMKIGGREHKQKAEDYVVFLEKWLKTNQTASSSDKHVAENVLKDLLDALGRKN